jgi:hypothetical protein
MVRAQENEQIYCDTPEFDDMVGFRTADFKSFVDTYIGGCKEWKNDTEMFTLRETFIQYALLMQILNNRTTRF